MDRNGRRVPGRSVFLQTFAHQLYPPTREPAGGQPESELRRLGVKARIEPGRDVPVTIAWRQKPGKEPPVRLRFPDGSLPLR